MMLVSIVRKMRLKTQANRWHLIRKKKHVTRTNILYYVLCIKLCINI